MCAYWVIEPQEKAVLAYGFQECGINQFAYYKENDTLRSYAFEGLNIDLGSVFIGM